MYLLLSDTKIIPALAEIAKTPDCYSGSQSILKKTQHKILNQVQHRAGNDII